MVYPAVMDDLDNRDDMATPEIAALRKAIDDSLDKTKALMDARLDHVKAGFDELHARLAERKDNMETTVIAAFRASSARIDEALRELGPPPVPRRRPGP